MVKKLIFLSSCLFYFLTSQSQTKFNYGFRIGIALDVGTHVNRVGLNFSTFQTYSYFNSNASINIYYNFQSLALKQKGFEIQTGLSIGGYFGKTDSLKFLRFGMSENNSVYKNGLAYAYVHYWDQQKTSQGNGQFIFEFYNARLIMANDLFGGGKGWRDRFRTGAFAIDYTINEFRFGISTTFWTGDFVGCEIVKNDSLYQHARFGYRKLEGSTYGNFSLGILSFNASYILPHRYFQHEAHLNTGFDAEKLRNGLQNRFVHNQRFIPQKFLKDVPHIPMISATGDLYLYQAHQQIKPLKYYLKIGINSPDFY